MYAKRVRILASRAVQRTVRVVHADEADRLVKAGYAKPEWVDGGVIRAVVLTVGRGSSGLLAPYSTAIWQELRRGDEVVGHAWAMKFVSERESWVL